MGYFLKKPSSRERFGRINCGVFGVFPVDFSAHILSLCVPSPLIDHYSYRVHHGKMIWSLNFACKNTWIKKSVSNLTKKNSYLKFALLISSRILLFVSFCTASSVFFEYFPFIAHSSRIECSKHAFWKSESTVQRKKILITKVQNCSVKVHVLWEGRKNKTKSPSWFVVYWSLFTEFLLK